MGGAEARKAMWKSQTNPEMKGITGVLHMLGVGALTAFQTFGYLFKLVFERMIPIVSGWTRWDRHTGHEIASGSTSTGSALARRRREGARRSLGDAGGGARASS
jgi:hypothetical protein